MVDFGYSPFEENDDDDFGELASTLLDLNMGRLSYTLRSKPSWWTKYLDPTIRKKWEEEGLALDTDGEGTRFTADEVKYVLDELKGFAALRDEPTGVQPSCYWRIWESDGLISEDLRQRLIAAVAPLEDVPDDKKDWHPGSNEQVLDLVHPSLFCLVYGKTMGLPLHGYSSGTLEVIQAPDGEEFDGIVDWAISTKFSWIPTDFAIAKRGSSAEAISYINNVHPSQTELVSVVEDVVARFTELFDRVLTDLIPDNGGKHQRVEPYYKWEDDGRQPYKQDNESDDAYWQRYDAWSANRPFKGPTVAEGGYARAKDISKRKQQYTLKGKTAQIIVKLANIHLTPEKPEYPGGTWHVEGMANEHIIASGIYYYDTENISESHLAFRCAAHSMDLYYEQSDEAGTKKAYGLDTSTGTSQNIGQVETKQGRCIAFPNLYQHKVSPFSLTDKTRAGHRKIMALFLVDPNKEIFSTTHIPLQQAHWALEAMQNAPEGGPFGKLPLELLQHITERTETLMTEQEAKQYRVELMNERKAFVAQHDEEIYGAPFSMCEH